MMRLWVGAPGLTEIAAVAPPVVCDPLLAGSVLNAKIDANVATKSP